MTNKSKARYGIRRSPKFTLNPTTRAIRSAFALGLALAASSPVLAGTCDVSDPTHAVCDGIFTGTNISYSIDDLTLVVGGVLDTLIEPPVGYAGIDLYSAYGSISLTSAADIITTYAAAIHVNAPYGDVYVENSGSLQTTNGDAIYARSYNGDVTVINDGSADVSGSRGIEARSGNGAVSVENAYGASVAVSNVYGNAIGIEARSYYGDISVINDGLVDVSVVGYGNATGVKVNAFFSDASVTNSADGVISATTDNVYGGQATAIFVSSYLGATSVTNYGDVIASATADYGPTNYGAALATGIRNNGGYYGITSTVNAGTVTATANNDDGVAWAWGVRSRGQNAELENSGHITADAYAYTGVASANGSYVRGGYYNGTSSTTNTGYITSYAEVGDSGTAMAYGAMTWGGYASVDNQGDISAHSRTAYGTALAQGSSSHYNQTIDTNNDGDILADSYAGVGFAASFAVYAYALDLSTVTNGDLGTITAVAEVGNGYAFAYGVWLDSGDLSTLTNYGSISASATVDAGGAFQQYGATARTIGASVKARYGDSYMTNGEYGEISAYSGVHGEYGRAYAFGAVVQGSNMARLVNDGSISAEAYAVNGYAISLGDIAYGGFAVNLNYGTISAESTVNGSGYAQAIGQYAFGETSTVINEGTVSASADVGFGYATADGAKLYGAWVATYNYGDISATANAVVGYADATGVDSFGISGSTVYNAANISASASAVVGSASAKGVYNFAYFYGAYVTNEVSIAATASTQYGDAAAIGVENIAFFYGESDTINHGDIIASASSAAGGTAEAVGVYTYGFIYGPDVYNSGTISASATSDGRAAATGIAVDLYHGDVLIQNYNQISADATSQGGVYGGAYATGVSVQKEFGKYNFPTSMLVNYGDITATATHNGDHGFAEATGVDVSVMYAWQYNYANITAVASSDAYMGNTLAVGSSTAGKYGVVDVNHGTISATAHSGIGGSSSAAGVIDYSAYDAVTVANYGDISASAYTAHDYSGGSARAVGVYAHANSSAYVLNNATISANATADYGFASATGVSQQGKYGVSTLVNNSTISATANAYSGYASAVGAETNSKYGAVTLNYGTISATANADYYGSAEATGSITQLPGAHGYFTYAAPAALYNLGDITAVANASGGMAEATGARVEGSNDAGAYTYNAGSITAVAMAGSGYASALGNQTWSYYGDVSLLNAGDISAYAHGDAAASAMGSITLAAGGFGYPSGSASMYNFGQIAATAVSADTAYAYGALVAGEQGAYVYNGGGIDAQASSDTDAWAYGLAAVTASGDVMVINTGSITATADAGYAGAAIAVYMASYGSNLLLNYGDIIASGAGSAHVAVSSSTYAQATIYNLGTMTGAIQTGNYDDVLVNYGTWNADGSSDFGLGDDRIYNFGTINLSDATIDLGYHAYYGNQFFNMDTITVSGDNTIDMGQGLFTVVPSLNPYAFYNYGTIDFQDGAADDMLTIVGDFAGEGEINVDVSGLNGVSDMLYIDGSVVDGTVQTINVSLLDYPTTGLISPITIVSVSGDSTAGQFVLGDASLAMNSGFLNLDFSLVSTIDDTNATADVFALNVDVAGLDDAGTLAAAVVPGVQSLMNSQVGTWRQRMGVINHFDQGAFSLWARVFQDKGAFAPEHSADNFGDTGNFDFKQKNSGAEVGLDFAINEEFSVGMLLAKAKADTSLEQFASGKTSIDGDTFGLYGTWISPEGFYVDSSYRWMSFTAKLDSAAGPLKADGDAGTFNVEAGYAWTLDNGMKIEPQAQYTWTQVDSIDPMVTSSGMAFQADDGDSSVGRLGVALRKSYGDAKTGWLWTPYATLSAVREFDGKNAYVVNDTFTGRTSIEGTSALLELGLTGQTGNWSLYGGLNWQDGGAVKNFFGGQVGARYTW